VCVSAYGISVIRPRLVAGDGDLMRIYPFSYVLLRHRHAGRRPSTLSDATLPRGFKL